MTKKTFKDWYSANRDKLSQQRKYKYQSDPEYRQKAIERASQRRSAISANKVSYHGYTVSEACDTLEISLWTMNRWRNENYFPVASLRGYRFSDNQIQLLGLLRDFFKSHPRRTLSHMKGELDSLVGVIHHNWS